MSKTLLGLTFIAAGILHFVKTGFYLEIMPPYLPLHKELVLASGLAASVLGGLLLIEATKRIAAWGIILFLIAVFPANIYLASHPGIFPGIPSWAHALRLPFQLVLIAWAYRYTRAKESKA